jgi:cyclophilin family peptidyl-prolyl cis-trans isomerase
MSVVELRRGRLLWPTIRHHQRSAGRNANGDYGRQLAGRARLSAARPAEVMKFRQIRWVACSNLLAGVFAMTLVVVRASATSPVPTPYEVAINASEKAWRPVAPENLLIMELDYGSRVAIELAPTFAPVHVANIRALVRGGWFDGNAVVRVQDNFVVQWGGVDAKRNTPVNVIANPPAEYDWPSSGLKIHPLPSRDPYATVVGYVDGWPVASNGSRIWLTHCYGMVGVGRELPPDTGTGAELYTVIGQAPRRLDRNMALVGRVIDGMEKLAELPRGTASGGYFTDPGQQVPIKRVWVSADMPEPDRPRYAVMRTDSRAFARYAQASANRRDAFFVRPADRIELCAVAVPIRRTH